MTMSADEARSSLAARVAERDRISTNLHALYESVGMKLLAGASLAGTTKQTWDEANADLAAMLETFTAYSDVLDRAAGTLGRIRRSAGPALAEVVALLTGPSVRLTPAPAPLARRGLTDSGQREITLTKAVEQMTKAFARITKVVTEAETVWNEVAGRLDGIDDELGRARRQAAGLADDAVTADVTAAGAELRSLRHLLNSDPFALRQGDQVDTARPDRLRARVSAVAARAGELARLRDDADGRLAAVARAVAEAQAAGRDAAAARAEAAEKITAQDLPWGPRADAGLTATGLDRQLAAAQELRTGGQWSRLAAEVASIEQAAAAAAERLRAAEREARWFLGQRHELWGRLGGYRAMADRMGGAEDPGLTTGYQEAEELLVKAPCRLTAAADAVTRYQQAVLAFIGRRPGP
jgi:hypothetical protein